MKIIHLLWLLTIPFVARAAQELPISFSGLPSLNPDEKSSLSAECDGGADKNIITCRFVQSMIRYKINPQEIESTIQDVIKEINKDSEGALKGLMNQCSSIRKHEISMDKKVKELAPAQNQIFQEMKRYCESPSKEKLETFVRNYSLMESKTCKVSSYQFGPITFKKMAPNKWVSTGSPQGLCEVINLTIMGREPDNDFLWSWAQTRTYVGGTGELCKNLKVNSKMEFSWRGGDVAMNCETISFGF